MAEFKDRLEQALKMRDMKASELAKLTKIGEGAISQYRKGAYKASQRNLEKISQALNVSIPWLMGIVDTIEIGDEPVLLKTNLSLFGNEKKKKVPDNVTPLSPSLSEDALQVAQDYSSLDKPGQRVVKVVIADQQSRVKEEKKKKRTKKYEESEFEGQETGRVIPRYFTPSAAGFASPSFGDDFEYLEVGGDVPPYADFAVDIDGDSMEPYIMNGSTVYVNRDPLQNADVGIFFCDGDMLCKQYYRDEWGNVWLLSLNRNRAEADRFIEAESDIPLVCYGRVILPHPLRLAVPENELL